jgi:DNA-binding IclR family transcriptional regulator
MEILRESVKPLKTLLKKVKETSYISILEGAFVFYLIQMDEYLSYQLLSDNKSPASCTSSGKVLLAYESLDKASKIIMKEQLLMQLTIIRETVYCIDVNEDVVSIAAPIRDYTCNVIAAVSTKSPRQKIDDHKIQLIKEEIIKTAKEISFQLGYLETIRYSK